VFFIVLISIFRNILVKLSKNSFVVILLFLKIKVLKVLTKYVHEIKVLKVLMIFSTRIKAVKVLTFAMVQDLSILCMNLLLLLVLKKPTILS